MHFQKLLCCLKWDRLKTVISHRKHNFKNVCWDLTHLALLGLHRCLSDARFCRRSRGWCVQATGNDTLLRCAMSRVLCAVLCSSPVHRMWLQEALTSYYSKCAIRVRCEGIRLFMTECVCMYVRLCVNVCTWARMWEVSTFTVHVCSPVSVN